MNHIVLGQSGLTVSKPGFGALPVQRTPMDEAVKILRRAYEGGIRYFDTANAYTDSEEKLGEALHVFPRESYVISTKSGGRDGKTVSAHIDESLRRLKTDYIDLFQFHFVQKMLDFDDPDGIYAAALRAKAAGKIRHIGVTSHNIDLAFELVNTGKFETMQFPFSYISGEKEKELVRLCAEKNIGFIAMKGLAGGLLTNARACHAFMGQYPNVVPIWGIQHMHELEEWLAVAEEDPALDDALRADIEKDREALCGSFCRGCGYCEPCPAGIEIHTCARMNMLLRRSPWQPLLSDAVREKMHKIEECLHCGNCASKCPYGLDASELMPHMLEDYEAFYAEHKALL